MKRWASEDMQQASLQEAQDPLTEHVPKTALRPSQQWSFLPAFSYTIALQYTFASYEQTTQLFIGWILWIFIVDGRKQAEVQASAINFEIMYINIPLIIHENWRNARFFLVYMDKLPFDYYNMFKNRFFDTDKNSLHLYSHIWHLRLQLRLFKTPCYILQSILWLHTCLQVLSEEKQLDWGEKIK